MARRGDCRPTRGEETNLMRAYDCPDVAHGNIHMTGADDQELMKQVQAHRDEFHIELTDDQIKEMVSQGAYDE
jgi:predicted small metal-binding protein